MLFSFKLLIFLYRWLARGQLIWVAESISVRVQTESCSTCWSATMPQGKPSTFNIPLYIVGIILYVAYFLAYSGDQERPYKAVQVFERDPPSRRNPYENRVLTQQTSKKLKQTAYPNRNAGSAVNVRKCTLNIQNYAH